VFTFPVIYFLAITNEYILKIKKERKNKKFIYQLEKTKCEESVFECWSEFPFESSRNFSNLFFSGKQEILEKIHFFLENRAWYESKGIPYTLGIGLHGPPGTGKTSFIKALANETGRHLVILSTKLLKTRRDLNRFYFEMRYNTLNEKDQITFDKKIIVFEDIDCIGEMVLNRAEVSASGGGVAGGMAKETALVVDKILKTMDKQESGPLVSSLMNKDDEPITLDDLLNLWDGIRETPGRILIISSNTFPRSSLSPFLNPAMLKG
jgi:nucleoside-triphosphatase THEP1